MSATTLVPTLQDGLDELARERQAFEESLEAEREKFAERERRVREAIEALVGPLPTNGASADGAGEEKSDFSVSQKKLDAVQKLIQDRGSMRQADIAKKLKYNSGTVSVALRKLQTAGVVSPGEKENGSRVWHDAKVLASSRTDERVAA